MEEIIVESRSKHWIEKSTKRRVFFLGILVVLFQVMKRSSFVLECYKSFYFKVVSPLLSNFSSVLKISYFIVLVVLVLILLSAFRGFKLRHLINSLIKFWSGVVIAFLVLWGFNYSRADLPVNPNPEAALELFLLASKKTEKFLLNTDSEVKFKNSFPTESEKVLNQRLSSITKDLFPKALVYPKPIPVFSDGALRKMGIGGVFFPFTHQPLYDNSAPNITKWFTYCHEYFHSVSVTGEDECNALAFYALVECDEPKFKLSAYLDLLRTCANVLGYSRTELKGLVGEKTYSLLEFIWEDQSHYVSGFHAISSASNDFYLKSLGSEDGIDSYNGYLNYLKIENGEITLYLEPEKQN